MVSNLHIEIKLLSRKWTATTNDWAIAVHWGHAAAAETREQAQKPARKDLSRNDQRPVI